MCDQKKPTKSTVSRSFAEYVYLQQQDSEPTWAELTLKMQQACDKTCQQTTLDKQEPNAPCSNMLSH